MANSPHASGHSDNSAVVTVTGSAHLKHSLQDYLSRDCALRCLDLPDLVDAGAIAEGDSQSWASFANDPATWLKRTDEATALKVWALVDQEAAQ